MTKEEQAKAKENGDNILVGDNIEVIQSTAFAKETVEKTEEQSAEETKTEETQTVEVTAEESSDEKTEETTDIPLPTDEASADGESTDNNEVAGIDLSGIELPTEDSADVEVPAVEENSNEVPNYSVDIPATSDENYSVETDVPNASIFNTPAPEQTADSFTPSFGSYNPYENNNTQLSPSFSTEVSAEIPESTKQALELVKNEIQNAVREKSKLEVENSELRAENNNLRQEVSDLKAERTRLLSQLDTAAKQREYTANKLLDIFGAGSSSMANATFGDDQSAQQFGQTK